MNAGDVKYFDGANGFLVLTTATNGNAILGLTNFSLDYSVEDEEVLTFEQNRTKSFAPTFDAWSVSVEGFFTTLTGDTSHPASGSTYVTGGTNGAALLEAAKAKATNLKIVLKISDNNYQKGSVIISSYNLTATAGETMKFTAELKGTTALTKSIS